METIKELEKGCGKDLKVYHGLGDEKVFWKCGERVTGKKIDYCEICETKLQSLKDVLGLIDEIMIDLDMPSRQKSWDWIKKELKQKITGE